MNILLSHCFYEISSGKIEPNEGLVSKLFVSSDSGVLFAWAKL